MKKFKIIILVVFLIIVGVVGYFGYNYYTDNKEKVLLEDEVEEILNYINEDSVNIDKINEIVGKDITTGNRLAVEHALENYILDSANAIKVTIDLLNDTRMTNLLSADNYLKDGPTFVNSMAYIKETKEKLLQNKQDILNLTDTSKTLSYFTNPTNDDYYEKMYQDLALGSGLKSSDITNFSNSIDSLVNLLNVSNEALTFLSQNANGWQIENNQIYFTNQTLLNTYNSYIAKIK